jgi:hypothetical protein
MADRTSFEASIRADARRIGLWVHVVPRIEP